ncbi:MAG: hypothetical protein ACOVO1_05305 [Chitinophagaceae bacterium]
MEYEFDFNYLIQKRISKTAIVSSTLRNQGLSGMIEITKNYLLKIDLGLFFEALKSEKAFKVFLDNHTNTLAKKYQSVAPNNWGAARKSLNIFFRDVVYNIFLSKQFLLPNNTNDYNKAIKNLEVPLDSKVAKAIIYELNDKSIKWKGVKHLTSSLNEQLQELAAIIANSKKTARVHLDLFFW